MAKKNKPIFYELSLKDLILNEYEVVEKMLKDKQIPSVYDVWGAVNRIARYYSEQEEYDKFEVVGLVVQFLTQAGINYDINMVVEKVTKIDVNDKDYHELRQLPSTIIFSNEEISTIKNIKSRRTQEFYFTLLIICKIQELKQMKNPNRIKYEINDIARLCNLNIGDTDKFLIELGYELQLISCPLDGSYIEVKKIGGKGNKKIKNFDPTKVKQYFSELIGAYEPEKAIIALDYYGDEKPQYFNSISEASRELGLRQSDISRALNPFGKRGALFVEDYMFIDAIRKEDESDKEYNIRMSASKMVMYSLKKCYRGLRSGKTKLSEEFFEEPKIDNKITELDEFVENMKTFGKRK